MVMSVDVVKFDTKRHKRASPTHTNNAIQILPPHETTKTMPKHTHTREAKPGRRLKAVLYNRVRVMISNV